MSVYLLEIDGDEFEVLKDSLDLDLQANWQSTLQCQIPASVSGSPVARVSLRSDVVLKKDGVPIFGGLLSQAPEEGWGGPNLDEIVQHISCVGYGTYFTYRHLNSVTFTVGMTVEDIATYLVDYLPDDVTLDPGQATGPSLTVDLVFNRTRLDDVLKAVTGETGYLPRITPDKLFSLVSPSSTPAPFNLIDSGPVYQIGDVKVERTLDDNYANRVFIAVQGAGPQVVTEYYVTPGSTWSYTTKYPASLSVMDMWPNELWVDEPGSPEEYIPYGPIGYGASPITNWDPETHTLTYTGTGVIPPTGSTIRITYAVRFPFFVEGNDLADQAIHPIKEAYESVNEAMTLEAAQAYADLRAASRAAAVTRVLYTTEESGLLPGMSQTITLPDRDIDAECLITEVKLRVPTERPGSEPIYEIVAFAGTIEQGNVRQVYKDWLDRGIGGVNSLDRSGASQPPGQPERSVQFNESNTFGGRSTFLFYKDEASVVCGELSSIDAASFNSCQVFGYDNHIGDP